MFLWYVNFLCRVMVFVVSKFPLQGYGLTETTATACVTDRYDMSTGRVGAPLQEVSNATACVTDRYDISTG